MPREIFVFGSNLAGRHGKGAALHARKHHGAIYGQAFGMQGNSFAIPTKDENLRVLPLEKIEHYVNGFLIAARALSFFDPDTVCNVTAIGCGLAGYKPEQIAPMFKRRTDNVRLPPEFLKVLNESEPESPAREEEKP